MKPTLLLLNILATIVLFTACCNLKSDESYFFEELNGKSGTFCVNLISTSPQVQNSSDNLSDKNYFKYDGSRKYSITFSNSGDIVIIEPGTIKARRQILVDNKITYNIIEDAFEGGRFVVWYNNKTYYSELTIYGSDVPILISERGKLVLD